MPTRTWTDRLVALYGKIFPWRFRHRYGAPFVRALMKMKGNKLVIKDILVFLNPEDKTARELFLVHCGAENWIWECYELGLFLKCLEANPYSLAVDLGANYGAYSLSCGSLAREHMVEKVIAVEPNKNTFACLKKSVEINGFSPYIHLVNAAVVKDLDAEFTFHPHGTFSAMSKTTTKPHTEQLSGHLAPYKVRGVTVDSLLTEFGYSRIRSLVMKIDVEGGEPDVFYGMEASINSAHGYQVFFELHPSALLSLGHDPLEFGRYLLALGSDVMAEVDQHRKVTTRIRNLEEFASIVEECLTTTEMWNDYTNIFISKGLNIPFEIGECRI